MNDDAQLFDHAARVMRKLHSDFENRALKPAPQREQEVETMLDQLIAWVRHRGPFTAKRSKAS
jgi:hypothetical protein